MEFEEIVALSVKHNASDLHLCCGDFPWWRREGRLEPLPQAGRVSQGLFDLFTRHWLSSSARQQLAESGQCELALTLHGVYRLRASLFRRQQGLSLALRILRDAIPTPQALGLPDALGPLMTRQHGLILVSGATGSGKTTSLAALVGEVNRQTARHIITLEDPVEYRHLSTCSLIQQREAGTDFISFSQGLRAALRQDPDIILLGELRDEETLRLALTAAETGHLILATLHTVSAAQSVERIIDSFSGPEQPRIQAQLAAGLVAVLCQRRDPQCTPLTDAASPVQFELLVNTPAVANVIREGKTHQLAGMIETGADAGMFSFRQSQPRQGSRPLPCHPVCSNSPQDD